MKRVDRSMVTRMAGVLLFVAAWQALAVLGNTRMLPGVTDVLLQLWELILSGELFEHALSTLSKGFAGLAIALLAGAAVGIACARNRYADAALHPVISMLYPVPKLALYPVVVLVFGFGATSKIVQVGLECFFPIFVQMYAGTRAVPRNLLWLAENNEVGPLGMVREVVLPTLLPYLLTGLRVATPIMLIVMCVTEFIGESEGLGYLISRYSSYFDTASAFAVIVVLGLFGLAADRLIVHLRTRVVFWERGVSL